MNALCVQTTALAQCVSRGLHAEMTAIREVAVVDEGRLQVDHQIAITNRTEPCQAPTSSSWTTTTESLTTAYAV